MDKKATLTRFDTGDQGTFGKMSFGSHVEFTGELPDNDNLPNFSCIPEGTYQVDWTYSPAFKRMMYLVRNVKGRSGIRIHSANLMGDTRKGYRSHLYGCIALGERLGTLSGQKALLVSRPAISTLERWGAGQTFELEILNA